MECGRHTQRRARPALVRQAGNGEAGGDLDRSAILCVAGEAGGQPSSVRATSVRRLQTVCTGRGARTGGPSMPRPWASWRGRALVAADIARSCCWPAVNYRTAAWIFRAAAPRGAVKAWTRRAHHVASGAVGESWRTRYATWRRVCPNSTAGASARPHPRLERAVHESEDRTRSPSAHRVPDPRSRRRDRRLPGETRMTSRPPRNSWTPWDSRVVRVHLIHGPAPPPDGWATTSPGEKSRPSAGANSGAQSQADRSEDGGETETVLVDGGARRAAVRRNAHFRITTATADDGWASARGRGDGSGPTPDGARVETFIDRAFRVLYLRDRRAWACR